MRTTFKIIMVKSNLSFLKLKIMKNHFAIKNNLKNQFFSKRFPSIFLLEKNDIFTSLITDKSF